ncbi:MAG: ISL3 family transposase [Arenicellales bacterium]|jgi:transposase|nr:ISL3 family transposase [Arenicellales bacterium]
MLIKTLLNRIHPVKGFVYEKDQLVKDRTQPNGCRLDMQVRPRRGSRGICCGCGRRGATYDHLGQRRFIFVPLWGIAVVLVYTMRRIDCKRCGVKVEQVPWANPASKSATTIAMELFLARWARLLSWKQVAQVFRVSWQRVYRSVESVVSYGLAHRELSGITAIGVDEIAYAKGHRYATLVYQIDSGGSRRLLYVGEGRTVKTLLRFFRMLQKAKIDFVQSIHFVCSDMWKPYLKVIAKKLPQALHILDRYHLVANLNKALDRVRAEEARQLKAEGWSILTRSRWLLLRRRKKLPHKQRYRLREILQWNLRTVRAYMLKEQLQALWEYRSPTYAGRLLDAWCRSAMRSRLEPMKKVARSLRQHRELILNWFRAKRQYNSGIVEAMNANVKLRFRKAYGFRTFEAIEVALYHQFGCLPEPESTHKFW